MSTQITVSPQTVMEAARTIAKQNLETIDKANKRHAEEYKEYEERGKTWWGRLWRTHPAHYFPLYESYYRKAYYRATALISAAKMCQGDMLLSADDAAFLTVEYVMEKQGE